MTDPVLANHGEIEVWNLLTGDTVIIDGLLATVDSDAESYGSEVEVSFLVYEILENDETTPSGAWLATPRRFTRRLLSGVKVPFLQRHEVTVFKPDTKENR